MLNLLKSLFTKKYKKIVDSFIFNDDGTIRILFDTDYFGGKNFPEEGQLFKCLGYIFYWEGSEMVEIKIPDRPLFSKKYPNLKAFDILTVYKI